MSNRQSVIHAPSYVCLRGTMCWSLTLTAQNPLPYEGSTAILTATANYDVGPTPWYIEIYDQTTGQQVCIAGSGTTCSASVEFSFATTQTYVAYVAASSSTAPPPSIQVASNTTTIIWRTYP